MDIRRSAYTAVIGLLAALSIASCFRYVWFAPDVSEYRPQVVSLVRNKVEGVKDAKVRIPVVGGLTDEAVRKRINGRIRSAVDELSFVDEGPEVLHVDYSVGLNRGGLLSLRIDVGTYFPKAAHGNEAVAALTFDVATGEEVAFRELFVPGAGVLLDTLLAKALDKVDCAFFPDAERGVFPDQEYYLTEDAVVAVFQKYTIGPGYCGVVSAPLPIADLREVIRPSGPIAFLEE